MPRKTKAQKEAEAAAKEQEVVDDSTPAEDAPAEVEPSEAEAPAEESAKEDETPAKEKASEVPAEVALEKVAIPRAQIKPPPEPRPAIQRVEIVRNGAGFFRGTVHDLPADTAEDLLTRKIAIRVVE